MKKNTKCKDRTYFFISNDFVTIPLMHAIFSLIWSINCWYETMYETIPPGLFSWHKANSVWCAMPPSAVVTCLQLSTSCCCWRGTATFCLWGRPLGLAADVDCSTLGLDLDETVLLSAVASNSPLEVDLGLGWDRWLPVLLDLDLSFSSSPGQSLSELVTLSLGSSSNNCDKKCLACSVVKRLGLSLAITSLQSFKMNLVPDKEIEDLQLQLAHFSNDQYPIGAIPRCEQSTLVSLLSKECFFAF